MAVEVDKIRVTTHAFHPAGADIKAFVVPPVHRLESHPLKGIIKGVRLIGGIVAHVVAGKGEGGGDDVPERDDLPFLQRRIGIFPSRHHRQVVVGGGGLDTEGVFLIVSGDQQIVSVAGPFKPKLLLGAQIPRGGDPVGRSAAVYRFQS